MGCFGIRTRDRRKEAQTIELFFKQESFIGLPNNFPIQQKDRLFLTQTFNIFFIKQPRLLLKGEFFWQASNSSILTKELPICLNYFNQLMSD